jgi:arsenate reductase (thioredoxin)
MKVLFLCTGNSCRSQMAEGWARHLKAGVIEPYSAGIEKHGLNPHAVKVMAEAGVDISRQFSKRLEELNGVAFDYVITVCGHAHEQCPVFPGATRVLHVGFEDPPKLTEHLPDGEPKLAVYRRVRDEIRRFVETLPEALASKQTRLEVYDPAMCCSTGVCGPEVDPVLVRFAADLKWLAGRGIEVGRFNLAQSPAAFVENEAVRSALTDKGEAALPIVLVSGRIVSLGRYPERDELIRFLGPGNAAASGARPGPGCEQGGEG